MKLNNGFVLREIAGENMLIPVGVQTNLTNGIVALSPVAATIWEALSEGKTYEETLAVILDNYEVSDTVAKSDLDDFLNKLKSMGMLVD